MGVACLRGYQLAFTRYSSTWGGGVADIIPAVGSEVWGLVYGLTDENLEALDVYEGYPRGLHPISDLGARR